MAFWLVSLFEVCGADFLHIGSRANTCYPLTYSHTISHTNLQTLTLLHDFYREKCINRLQLTWKKKKRKTRRRRERGTPSDSVLQPTVLHFSSFLSRLSRSQQKQRDLHWRGGGNELTRRHERTKKSQSLFTLNNPDTFEGDTASQFRFQSAKSVNSLFPQSNFCVLPVAAGVFLQATPTFFTSQGKVASKCVQLFCV